MIPQLTLTDNERYIRYTKIRMARNAAINLIKQGQTQAGMAVLQSLDKIK